MRHIAWAGMAVTTAIAVAASCVPDFEFKEQSSSSTGEGAAGGGTTGTGGAASSTTSASSGGGGDGAGGGMGGAGGGSEPTRQVACGEPTSTECAEGDICCYHTQTIACDKCGPGRCIGDGNCATGGYIFFYCDDAQDCPAGKMCCMTYIEMLGVEYYQGSQCQDNCSAVQYRLCSSVEDCDPGQACVSIDYPGYMRCL